MSAQSTASLVERLAGIVGAQHVSADADDLVAAAGDGLRAGRIALLASLPAATPLAVIRPDSTEQVSAIVRVASDAGVPVVPYGGGTGLMGGARTVRPGIVLDLRRMDRVLEVAPEDRAVRVQAGVVFSDLNAALLPHGLFCGHDPWTVGIATVGGAISTHGLGYLAGRYGSIGDQVLGLEVVLADGAVVRTRAVEKSSTGPQLRRLWVGAEGTLGVVTEATLRVFPLPEERRLRAVQFPGFSAGYDAVCAFAPIGLRPAMVDFGGPPRDAGPARMHLAFDGFREEVDALDRRATAICAERGGVDLGPEAAEEFFGDRHVDPERIRGWRRAENREPGPGTPGSAVFDYLHLSVPQSRVLEFFHGATDAFEAAGAQVSEWGLWHQPELVSLVARRRTDTPADVGRLAAAHDAVVGLAQDLGGSMEYVHGAGLRLAHLMEREHGAALHVLRRVKRALDPDGLLNPGKLGLADASDD